MGGVLQVGNGAVVEIPEPGAYAPFAQVGEIEGAGSRVELEIEIDQQAVVAEKEGFVGALGGEVPTCRTRKFDPPNNMSIILSIRCNIITIPVTTQGSPEKFSEADKFFKFDA